MTRAVGIARRMGRALPSRMYLFLVFLLFLGEDDGRGSPPFPFVGRVPGEGDSGHLTMTAQAVPRQEKVNLKSPPLPREGQRDINTRFQTNKPAPWTVNKLTKPANQSQSVDQLAI